MKIYQHEPSLPDIKTTFFVRDDRLHKGTIVGFTGDEKMSYAVIDSEDNELLSVPVKNCEQDEEQATYGHYRSLIEDVRRLKTINKYLTDQRDQAVMEAAELRGRCVAHGIDIQMPEHKE